MKEITVCLMTCGEETESECLKAIEHWRDKVEFQEVRNVTPQIKALNQMLLQTNTEFLIPLDADMVLNHDAYDRICRAIDKFRHDANWHSILFKLWDTLTEKEILALKILRTQIMKVHLFNESATPDVEHFHRLTGLGYSCIDSLLVKNPIGKHIVRGKHFCYHKYRDVYMTLRVHGYEWDSGVFVGGETVLEKSKAHFDFFLSKYIETNNTDYLWCIAGMTDGLVSDLENRSKSLSDTEYKYKEIEILDAYWAWYSHRYNQIASMPVF